MHLSTCLHPLQVRMSLVTHHCVWAGKGGYGLLVSAIVFVLLCLGRDVLRNNGQYLGINRWQYVERNNIFEINGHFCPKNSFHVGSLWIKTLLIQNKRMAWDLQKTLCCKNRCSWETAFYMRADLDWHRCDVHCRAIKNILMPHICICFLIFALYVLCAQCQQGN